MPARRQSAVTLKDEEGLGSPAAEGRGRGKDGKEKETFACAFPGCGQTYSRMEYLKRHQRKHQDDRPFQCKDCSKAFARSDVLLRHRRRCHPTPPPDRSSHSPPPPHRNYPGVPISSSRTDAREASPQRGRKHPRQSSTSSHDGAAQRRRLTEDDDDDDDDQYGESSRFVRQNGMGNGGVYGMNNNYFAAAAAADSANYTPHLLPMFQQSQGYHNLNDPNHLEDASVLLSMAYPGGVPAGGENNQNNRSGSGSGSGMTVGGQTVVPDWEGSQTINMMMESAAEAEAASRTNSVGSTNGDISSANAAVLPESMGNFLGTMNWLTSATGALNNKDGNSGEAANAWALTNPSPSALSPFPLSSLFSPSAFGISLPGTGAGANSDEDDTNNAAVMSILDQLAMFDVPQTKNNMNPERPMLRIANGDLALRQGRELDDRNSPFFVDSNRFSGCYSIPHWRMPPIRVLSIMACRTFHTVLNHFSFVHMPTFRLVDTAACLAFAICTVGGIRTGRQKWDYMLGRGRQDETKEDGIDGPVPPGRTWESMYAANYSLREKDEDAKKVENWESGPIVRNEKTNMLVKSFSLAKGVLMTEYNVALLQALVLYHAPYFLSQDEQERQLANMFLGTIANISRQVGFFVPELEHFEPEIQAPQAPFTPNEVNLAWRRWIQLETRRRTAYLVYHLDTISALESNIPCILSSCEISLMPLPAPDTLWKAATAEEWHAAVQKYKPMTLDEAMRRIFYLPTYGAFDTLHEKADTKFYNLLNKSDYGPFARVAMVLTLLRGIMEIGEGKRDRGDWRDLTDLWVSCSWLKPHKKMLSSDGTDLGHITRESLRGRFAMGLEKWRQGWDFDSLCLSGTTSSPSTSPAAASARSASAEIPEQAVKLNYCEEALPFYWLAQALLNILNSSPPHEAGYNSFQQIRYGEMLKSARTFTRLGEGVVNPGPASRSSVGGMSTSAASVAAGMGGGGSVGSTPLGEGELTLESVAAMMGLSPDGLANLPGFSGFSPASGAGTTGATSFSGGSTGTTPAYGGGSTDNNPFSAFAY